MKLKHIMLTFVIFFSITNSAQNKRPNIVWVVSEDNSMHYLKMYNERGISTPNIEKLAKHGLTFDHAFSNAPVCSAARSTIITGMMGPKIGAHYHRRLQKVPMPEGLKMFPSYLRDAGYYTTNNAKEDYNVIKTKGVWNKSNNKATWRDREAGQPFFHVQNFMTSHEGRVHFGEGTMESKKTNVNPGDMILQPNHPNTELFRYTQATYLDVIKKMDKQVGEVVAKLEEDGLMDDTFIFYYGDHGGVLPGSKGYVYETGLHVPLVVYVPKNFKHLVKMPIPQRVDGFVNFIDLAPTVLNLAGVNIPEQIDGAPFLGRDISKKDLDDKQVAFGYADRFDEKYDMVRTIRKGKYKYIRSYQPFNVDGLYNSYRYKQKAYKEWREEYKKGNLNKVQAAFFKPRRAEMLFNVEEDPYETKDLSLDKLYSEKLEELRNELTQNEKAMPDLAFIPEYELINNAFDNPVAYGQKNKANIDSYIETANLQLLPYKKVKSKIKDGLNSKDPWIRYWSLINCSVFGKEAKKFNKQIKIIAQSDPVLMNRVRAAEFLSLTKVQNPKEVMLAALYDTTDEAEALLILNSIALVSERNSAHKMHVDKEKMKVDAENKKSLVKIRLKYINSL